MMKNDLKPFDEKECTHCRGLISIRMPVPSSGCDHLYYPEACAVCREAERRIHPSELDLVKAELQKERERSKELVGALEKIESCERADAYLCAREALAAYKSSAESGGK